MKLELGSSSKDGRLRQGSSLINSKINLCRITNGVAGILLLKGFLEKFKLYSNLTLKCPVSKGSYTINNYEITDDNFPKLLLQSKKYLLFLNITAKPVGMKKVVLLFTLRSFNEFE